MPKMVCIKPNKATMFDWLFKMSNSLNWLNPHIDWSAVTNVRRKEYIFVFFFWLECITCCCLFVFFSLAVSRKANECGVGKKRCATSSTAENQIDLMSNNTILITFVSVGCLQFFGWKVRHVHTKTKFTECFSSSFWIWRNFIDSPHSRKCE